MSQNRGTGRTAVEENKKNFWKRILIFAFMFILAGGIAFAGGLLYRDKTDELIRDVVMTLAGTGIVIFSFTLSEINGFFIYHNETRYGRFAAMYIISLIASMLLPYLPVAGWPFLVIFVLLGVFSNGMTGLAAGSVCLLTAVNYSGGDYAVFILYFISGLAGILVFSTLDDDFRVGLPFLISMLILTLCLTANVVLFSQESLSAAQFMIPAVNLMTCYILLLVSLKMFSSTVIHRYREKYMEINDPECPLLVQLKDMSKEEYYHAVHTAYLGDKIARRLNLDDAAVKACGYYHRIGFLKGENNWENVSAICQEYHFPPRARKILKEYVDADEKVVSKETIIVLFADCIVSSILYLFAKDPKAELDYEQLIDTVFRKKLETEELWCNEISLAQIYEMKKIFIEEKLYYDFLR
ncbi:MAG: hypothetical protein J6A08_02530 [Lachnospiraceae bacterium]|nr:hypothetical protein [Lachnospiraceae bacterium]